jgi:hypothetical protein
MCSKVKQRRGRIAILLGIRMKSQMRKRMIMKLQRLLVLSSSEGKPPGKGYRSWNAHFDRLSV